MSQKVRFDFAVIVIVVREVVQDLCHCARAIYNNHKQIQETKTDNIAQKPFFPQRKPSKLHNNQ